MAQQSGPSISIGADGTVSISGLSGNQSGTTLGKGASTLNSPNAPTINWNGSPYDPADLWGQIAKSGKDNIAEWQKSLFDTPWGQQYAKSYVPGEIDTNMQGVFSQIAYAAGMEGIDLKDYLQRANDLWAKTSAARNRAAQGPSQSQKAENTYMDDLSSIYLKTWGTAPPPGYIEGIAKSGMNIYEFEAHERAKPAFANSPVYQYQRISLEGDLARQMGFEQ